MLKIKLENERERDRHLGSVHIHHFRHIRGIKVRKEFQFYYLSYIMHFLMALNNLFMAFTDFNLLYATFAIFSSRKLEHPARFPGDEMGTWTFLFLFKGL